MVVDARAGIASDAPADLETVHVGKIDVQQHDGRLNVPTPV